MLTHPLSPTRSRWGLRDPRTAALRAAHAQHPTVSAARGHDEKDRRPATRPRLWNPGHTARHLWKLSPKSRFGCPPHPKSRRLQGLRYVSPPRHLSIRQTRAGWGEGRELQRASRFYSRGVGQLANQEAYRACDVTWRWAIDVPRPPLQPRPRLPRRAPPLAPAPALDRDRRVGGRKWKEEPDAGAGIKRS